MGISIDDAIKRLKQLEIEEQNNRRYFQEEQNRLIRESDDRLAKNLEKIREKEKKDGEFFDLEDNWKEI